MIKINLQRLSRIVDIRKNQSGFVTLISSLTLMFLMTFTVFMGSRNSIVEQQTVTNLYTSEIAFNNAEEGIAAMWAKVKVGITTAVSVFTDTGSAASNLTTYTKYKVTYTPPVGAGSVGYITSVGKSFNGAERAVTQRIIPGVSGTVSGSLAGINTLGSISYGGNFKSSSVDAGGSVTGKSENAGTVSQNSSKYQTSVTSTNGSVLLDTNGNAITRLMTPNEQFMYFFGDKFCPAYKASNDADNCFSSSNNTYISGILASYGTISSSLNTNGTAKGKTCSGKCGSTFQADYAKGIRYFVVTGGISINNSDGITSSTPLGTTADPVYIFVMDNSALDINGNAVINGLIYVHTAASTYSCSCKASASVLSILTGSVPTYSNDLKKTIYTLTDKSTVGSLKCSSSSCIDSKGNSIPKNSYYLLSYVQIVGTKTETIGATLGSSQIALATVSPANPAQCSVSACTSAANVCTPVFNPSTKVADILSCNYQTPAISVVVGAGGTSANVVLNILSESSFTGTGNSVINGSFITSGNISTTNGSGFVDASGGNTSAMQAGPPTLDTKGWTDML